MIMAAKRLCGASSVLVGVCCLLSCAFSLHRWLATLLAALRKGEQSVSLSLPVHSLLCDKYLQHQHSLYHVFVDFKKAFDRVWHAAL